jgi:hypothetical protein
LKLGFGPIANLIDQRDRGLTVKGIEIEEIFVVERSCVLAQPPETIRFRKRVVAFSLESLDEAVDVMVASWLSAASDYHRCQPPLDCLLGMDADHLIGYI